MPTDAHTRCSDISLSSHRLANIIYRGLNQEIDQHSAEQLAAPLTLHRLPRTSPSQLMRVQIGVADAAALVVSVTVTHTASNVYDVVCEIENGSSHRFSYRLPAGAHPTPLSASRLGQEIGDFLLDELEGPSEPQIGEDNPPTSVAQQLRPTSQPV